MAFDNVECETSVLRRDLEATKGMDRRAFPQALGVVAAGTIFPASLTQIASAAEQKPITLIGRAYAAPLAQRTEKDLYPIDLDRAFKKLDKANEAWLRA